MADQTVTPARSRAEDVTVYTVTGVTSSAPAKVHKVPKGAGVKIYPTSAGTASVYSTTNPKDTSDGDNTNAEITTSGAASWDQWGAGDVTVATTQVATVPVETVAIVVTSGTWTIEVAV